MQLAPTSFAQQELLNRCTTQSAGTNLKGPGHSYVGVNGADRGLGYIGSYPIAGGFVPTFGDDSGGVWNADVRGHLQQRRL